LETIGEGLSLYGHTVTAALSGKEALELFDKFTFDVVICDLGMEGMNGWEVSRALDDLCSLRGIPKPPFILLTGWGRQIQDPNAPKPTVDRVLCKPISIFTLLEAVNEIVDRNESRVSRQTGRQWLV
jgi:CheY-like chemotaxis protein